MKKMLYLSFIALVVIGCGCRQECENPKFKKGDIVYHHVYGVGVVVQSAFNSKTNECEYRIEVEDGNGGYMRIPTHALEYLPEFTLKPASVRTTVKVPKQSTPTPTPETNQESPGDIFIDLDSVFIEY